MLVCVNSITQGLKETGTQVYHYETKKKKKKKKKKETAKLNLSYKCFAFRQIP